MADGGSLPGRAGAVSRHFRVSSWSLLRVMIASAVGCRRRVRSSPAVPTTAGAGAAAPLEAQAGSAAQVSQLAAEAMQTVNESFPAGNADDSTVKYSRCLKMLGLDSIMEDLEFGVSVLTSLSMESLSLDGGSSTVDAAIPKTPSVKVLSPQKSTPPTGTPPLQASRSPAWGASPDLAPATVMLEWAEVEATAVSRLTFLASLRDVPALTQQLKTSRMISLCFRLLRIASPRLQRLSLLLLEAVLPSTAPNTADAAVLSAGLATPPSLREVNATVTALLQIVADASLPGSTQGVACPVGYGSGHVLLSLRAWTLSVLRALFIAPDWTAAVWKALELALNLVLPGVQSPASASQAPFALAIAACAVLGGVSEVLRVGARVVTTQVLAEAGLSGNSVLASQWAGTVVRYSRSAALASVVYDPTAPLSDVEASDLVPIDALPLPVACAILPGPVMLALSAILSVTMPDLPAPQEDAVTPDPEGDVGDAKKGPKAASVKDSAAAASVPKNDDTVPMQDLAADVDNFRLWITALQKVRDPCAHSVRVS